MNCLDRRLELLKLEGQGFQKPEVVKELTQKFQCSKQLIYYDYNTRIKWQPTLQDLDAKKLMLKIYNRAEFIYRKASYMLITSQNENAQIGALKTMLAANQQFIELVVPQGAQLPQPDVQVGWVDDAHLKEYDKAVERAVDENIQSRVVARLNGESQP